MAKKENQSVPLTYRDAGVDIDAGDTLVDAIKPVARRTNAEEQKPHQQAKDRPLRGCSEVG